MSIQIAVRLPEEMVAFLDQAVAQGKAASRAALVSSALEREMRRQAAQTFVAVVMDEANTQRFEGAGPDVAGAARIISDALT